MKGPVRAGWPAQHLFTKTRSLTNLRFFYFYSLETVLDSSYGLMYTPRKNQIQQVKVHHSFSAISSEKKKHKPLWCPLMYQTVVQTTSSIELLSRKKGRSTKILISSRRYFNCVSLQNCSIATVKWLIIRKLMRLLTSIDTIW